ncbi:MAG: glycosyltransferase [bacterium]
MKRVLFVCYAFPPMAAVGAQRIVNFCKFLPRWQWQPVVLTVKGGVNSSWDASPLEQIPETIIYRSWTFEPFARREIATSSRPIFRAEEHSVQPVKNAKLSLWRRIKRFIRLLITVPDSNIFWVPFGVMTGLKAIRRERIDIIVSSSPPVSGHIIASILSRLTGKPHIVDFRDLWTLNHAYAKRNYPAIFRKYDRFWERFVLKHAVGVTTASPGFSRQMEPYLEGRLRGKITTITNGFDYKEFSSLPEICPSDKRQLRFLYSGSLYGDFNPVFFLKVLSRWMAAKSIAPDRIRVEFYGNHDYDYTDFLKKLRLEQTVMFNGFKPRKELVPLLLQADYLLLLLGFNEESKNVIPAKLLEYLASGTKILALAPEGVTTSIIRRYRAGECLSEPDENLLAEILNRILLEWENNLSRNRGFRYIEEFDREKLVGNLAQLLDKVTQRAELAE